MSNNDRTQQRSRPKQAQRNPRSSNSEQTVGVPFFERGYQPKARKTSPQSPPKNPPNKGSSGKKPVGNE